MPVPSAVIAIAGGTGSGKTSIANRIAAEFPEHVTLLAHDAYYRDNSHLSYEERANLNYDHPNAFDNDLFIAHLRELRAGRPIERPVYNFATHLREPGTVQVEPAHIIVVEGVMVLEDPRMRELYDLKVFVDTDADVRILRRIIRDINERGRTLESVIKQYLSTVKPMHEAFVEPTKRYANVIIPEGAHNHAGLEVLMAQVRHLIAQREARV
ncbi:uridine kinase [Symbiobacterium terraclitae]|uniref:uridine kinase n=1 Tax=Symbiobacterium terraclitae TaxID=557451 RepID=UPI0035B56317